MGHMMSTMVLSRKQSVFGASSLPAGVGVPEQLDRSKFEDNEHTVVMETKLKILEILQVLGRWLGGPGAGVTGSQLGDAAGVGQVGGRSRGRCHKVTGLCQVP